jgi:hypothetical protein
MMNVRPAIPATGETGAGSVDWSWILSPLRIPNRYIRLFTSSKRSTEPARSGGHNAVKHIDTVPHCFNNVSGCPYSHEIANPISWQLLRMIRENFVHYRLWFTNTQTTNRVPIERHAAESFGTLSS